MVNNLTDYFIQESSSVDTASTLTRGVEISLRHIAELKNTIEVQRKIIAEQAAKIHELQEQYNKQIKYFS
jgi:hypothetical protein